MSNLKPQTKTSSTTIKWVVGAVVLLGGSWIVYRKIILPYIQGKGTRNELKDIDDLIKKDKLTLPLVQYSQWANQLFVVMDGPTYIGLEKLQNDLLTIGTTCKTQSDWLQVKKEFGKRKSTSWFSDFEGGLTEWLRDELPEAMFSIINQKFLAKFGIGL